MPLPVILSEPALQDLFDINDYYLFEVSDKTAEKIIQKLEAAVDSLVGLSERGTIPKEMLSLGIRQYRQKIVKPYRIIYEILADKVIIHAVLDGRRDMQTLLIQRLVLYRL